jgi:hypothetical protein
MKEFLNKLSEIKEKNQVELSIRKEVNKKMKNELIGMLEYKKEIKFKKTHDEAAMFKMTQKVLHYSYLDE